MTYLVKRLQSQELGSISPDNPRPSRGRYLFMSKDNNFLQYLPHLSQTVLNDFTILTLIPLYKDQFERSYCTFVYNNDKFHPELRSGVGKPRNEMRIYSNKSLEDHRLLFQAGDILVLKPQMIQIENENHEIEEERVYFTYLAQDRESEIYQHLDTSIDESRIRGNYAVLEEPISEIEDAITALLSTNESQTEQFNEENALEVTGNINRISNTSETAIEGLFTNQTIFRNFVQAGYNRRCAITGQVIRCGDFHNLQAAHIHPRSHAGQYTPNNGILMNRDMHWAFDTGCFTINDDYTIRVHPQVESDYLQSFNGQSIRLPEDEFFRPALHNLHYHQNHIYGAFLERGRII